MNNVAEGLSQFEQITIQQANRDFVLNVIIAIITFLSVILIYIDYRNRKNKERAEKSINLAEVFAQSVIPKISVLFDIFERVNLMEIINKVKFINFNDFDNDEVHELYSDKDIENYKKIINENINVKIHNQDVTLGDFIVALLNELEHMSMYISTRVADEKYIYNSLHQQFIKTVSALYLPISLTNIDNKDKYYTNIIEVFNLWKNKYIKFSKREKKLKGKLKPQNPKAK